MAASKRYLNNPNVKKQFYNRIINYFTSQSPRNRSIDLQPLRYERENHTPEENRFCGPVNKRKCLELTHAYMNAGGNGITELSKLLCDITFVMAKFDCGLIQDLLHNYVAVQCESANYKNIQIDRRFPEYFMWVRETSRRWITRDISVLQSAIFMPIVSPVYKDAMNLLHSYYEMVPLLKNTLVWRMGKPDHLSLCLFTLEGID
jgi:hypothetical protein